ncbi:hypothetical protein CKA32_004910 [Geitlerinema sp. FC II]|nr:hypothetical protein CKA32_004910 [Geitlerinema sp. FC II]
MKVRYLTTLATLSVLSFGVAFGCANPCAAQDATSPNAEEAMDPDNPCAGDNPCAAKEDNPCAGDNPCAAKEDNPCAAN